MIDARTHALSSALVLAAAAAQSQAQGCGNIPCPQVIVALQPNQTIGSLNSALGTTTVQSIPSRRTHLLALPPTANLQVVLAALQNDPRVAWAERNTIQTVPAGGTQSFFLNVAPEQYPEQPAAALVSAPAAQAIAKGAGAKVAVLDTGIDPDHPLLLSHVAPGGYNFIDNTTDYRDVGNGLDDDGDTLIDELTGHGTFVSGLVHLVAPEADILPIKVLNSDGVGTAFVLAQGIDAAAAGGASVINISLGANVPSRAVEDAVAAALAQGCVIVAAVGNADRQQPPLYPAAYAGVLAVAGTDVLDFKAAFSDYGSYVALAAPATEAVGPMPGGGYAKASGVSCASPLVAGTAALVHGLAGRPSHLSTQQLIVQGADDISVLNPAYVGLLGSGRLNAAHTVSAFQGPSPCYANCDGSTVQPMLNVNDFVCFQARFAEGHPAANCDESTIPPVLNVNDFVCFQQKYAAGCP